VILGQQNRFADYFVSRSRLALTVDTRTATEYGVVRTFGQGDFQFNNFGSSNPTTLLGDPGRSATTRCHTAGGGYVAVEYLFIQFAGFTFGKSSSAYSTPWNGFPGNISSSLLGGNNTDTGVNNIQYTAEFGNGVSASIGLDDPTVWDRTVVYNLSIPGGDRRQRHRIERLCRHPCARHRRQNRVDQAWGLFQVSAAAHEVNGRTTRWAPAVSRPTCPKSAVTRNQVGRRGDGWVADQEPADRAGDDIKVDASYAKGATNT
jgi:hypothetical protein